MKHMGTYSVVLGPNTKQLWVYDEENDTFIDPPAAVLEALDEEYDWLDWEGKEEALQAILDEDEPDWLFDEEYIYDAEEFDI
jgi:hypothetical protein